MSTQLSEGGLAGSAPSIDEAEDRSIGSITERAEAADERFYYANPWKLIWWRFRRHRLALISLVLLLLLYLSAIFAEFVSPYTATWRAEGLQMMPPTKVHMIHNGQLQRPFIYALEKTLDQKTFKYVFTEDTSTPIRSYSLSRALSTKFWVSTQPVFIFLARAKGLRPLCCSARTN